MPSCPTWLCQVLGGSDVLCWALMPVTPLLSQSYVILDFEDLSSSKVAL